MCASFSKAAGVAASAVERSTLQIAQHRAFVAVGPQPFQTFFQQIGLQDLRFRANSWFSCWRLSAVRMHPAAQQQPAFPFHHAPHSCALAEELRTPHFIDRLVGVLHDVELVVDDAQCGAHCSMLFRKGSHMSTQAASIRFRWRRSTRPERNRPASLSSALGRTTAARRFPDCTPPSEISAFSHYRSHPHPSAAVPACAWRFPALQIPQIDGSYRTLRQPEPPGHLPRRRTLAGLSHRLFEALAKGRLARQLLDLLGLHSAVWAANPVQFDHHCRPILEARQIPHLPLVDLVDFLHPPPATGSTPTPGCRASAAPTVSMSWPFR